MDLNRISISCLKIFAAAIAEMCARVLCLDDGSQPVAGSIHTLDRYRQGNKNCSILYLYVMQIDPDRAGVHCLSICTSLHTPRAKYRALHLQRERKANGTTTAEFSLQRTTCFHRPQNGTCMYPPHLLIDCRRYQPTRWRY